MCDDNKNAVSHPELSAEKGWTELEIPDSYGKGQAFITGDRNSGRLRVRYFIKDRDNSFIARVWFGPSTEPNLSILPRKNGEKLGFQGSYKC